MLILFKALLMGIVEGITEFLPISSTGHLILMGSLINFKGKFATMFEIVIQLGAIMAVVFYYREKIVDSLQNIHPGKWGFKLWSKMLIAFLPSAVLGLLLNDFIEEHLFSPLSVAVALIIGAGLLLAVEKYFTRRKYTAIERIGGKNALLIGLAQCLSLIPGMSRSASTIMGGLVVGLTPKAAAEFSFFLAIPTMFAATSYSLAKGFTAMAPMEWAALAIGFVTSFAMAYIVVEKFISFLGRHSLKGFAYYRLAVGFLMILLIALKLVK